MSLSARAIVACLLGLAISAHAAQHAVTEKGDEVILEEDGTWHFVKAPSADSDGAAISVNATRFARAPGATFAVRSTHNTAVVYLDPKKWRFLKGQKGGDVEFTFQAMVGDLYGALITERIGMPLETLSDLALNNMRKVSPDAEVLSKEYRYVNDKKVLCMSMSATVRGMKLVYTGYYYSDENGTTQLLVYTSQNLLKGYRPTIDAFLNGLTFEASRSAAE